MKTKYIWPKLIECNCIKRSSKICFFASHFNAICSINVETGDLNIEYKISDVGFDKRFLVANISMIDDKVICVPCNAKKIYIIDFCSKNEIAIDIHKSREVFQQGYYNACLNNGYFYFFPFSESEILELDLNQRSIKKINVKEKYESIFGCDYEYFSNSGFYVFENRMYMIMRNSATIIEFDFLSKNTYFYDMKGTSPIYVHLIGYGQYLYILGSDGQIYVWSIKKYGLEKTIKSILNKDVNERYKHSLKYDKYIYIFQYVMSKEFIRIDVESARAEILSIKDFFEFKNSGEDLYIYMVNDDEKFYFLSSKHLLYIVDCKTNRIKAIPLILNEKNNKIILSYMNELDTEIRDVMVEGTFIWTLENYIRRHVNIQQDLLMENKNVGNRIYIFLK